MRFLTSLFITKYGHCNVFAIPRLDKPEKILMFQDAPLAEIIARLDTDPPRPEERLELGEFFFDPQKLREFSSALLPTGAFQATGRLVLSDILLQHIPVWRIVPNGAAGA
ncbi:hypothetical protein [Nitrogeniibacter aestuarii]|uniref:hypothetical protein n=1 Tax=Nitrogeniibacter aestuarii TaxID=2815343 RepID=UPI001E40199B|nr:hypothetical protein [Nitrogeniibacter aestuarii]